MTLNTYKSPLHLLDKQSYYVELSNFIQLQDVNGGAIFCNSTGANLYVTISFFYRCSSSLKGACIFYGSYSTLITKCLQLSHGHSDDSAPTIYSNSNNFQCINNGMDVLDAYSTCLTMFGGMAQLRSINISNTKIDYQVGGFISRCRDKVDIKYVTLLNTYDNNGCTITIYYSKNANMEYMNVFNSTVNSTAISTYGLLLFGYGAYVSISNSVFQHYNHNANVAYFESDNEQITITNCVFDTICETTLKNCTTNNIRFVSDPTYIVGSPLSQICKLRGTLCICNQSIVQNYMVFVVIVFLISKK